MAANLNNANIPASDVTSYSFSNGITTFSSTDPNVRLNEITVSTNSSGAVTGFFEVWLNRWNILPHSSADDASGRLSYLYVTNTQQRAQENMACDSVSTAPSGTTDTCTFNGEGSDRTEATTNSANTLTVGPVGPLPAPVPTLSEWAMILFGTILAGGAALYIQRRRFTA